MIITIVHKNKSAETNLHRKSLKSVKNSEKEVLIKRDLFSPINKFFKECYEKSISKTSINCKFLAKDQKLP